MSRRAAAILLAVLTIAVAALLLLSRGTLTNLRRRVPRPFLRVTPAPAPAVSVKDRAAVQELERRAEAARIVGVPDGWAEE